MKMIKHILLAMLLFTTVAAMAQNKNPYKNIGKNGEILTLTKGRYEELFDQDSIQQIGTALINVRTMKVVRLLKDEEAKDRLQNEKQSRFLSVDPISAQYPMLTPYQFASNGPIAMIDLDGLEGFISISGTQMPVGRQNVQFDTDGDLIPDYNQAFFGAASASLAGGLAIVTDIFVTKGKAMQFLMTSRLLGTLYHNRAASPEQEAARKQEFKSASSDMFIGWGAVKILGGVVSVARSGVPQGLTASEFKVASQRIYNEVKDLSDDIVVQGSRAAGTAKRSSDIDFAIRVNSKEFDQLIVKSFGSPKEGTAKWKTMQNAIKTGKIQSGEAGLRPLRKNLEKLLGKEVDISVIKKGGEFDNGIIIPIKKP